MATPAPTAKSRKASDAYRLFPCSKAHKSSKAPTASPTKSTRRLDPSPGSKSPKCAKSSKAPTSAPTATVNIVAVKPEEENVGLVEKPEYPNTAEGATYFVVAGTGGAAAGSGALSGGDGESTAEGAVTFEYNDNGNSTATTAGVTLTSGADAEDSCVVEASSQASGTLVELPLTYQAVFVEGSGSTVLDRLDWVMANYAAYDLFSCGGRRMMQSSTPFHTGGRALDELGCVGVNSDPKETVTGKPCTVTVEDGQLCRFVEGGLSLITNGDSTAEAAKEKALEAIETAVSNDVFTDSNSDHYVPGLVSITLGDPPEQVVAPATTTPGSSIKSAESATAPISAAGAVVLSLGLIAFIALALLAFRHKRKRDSAYDEFDDDFEDDLVAKETSSTDGSLDDILRDLDNAYGNQVDVHQCNSAMCQICNGRQTMFIDAGDNDTVSEMYPDQFEIGADRTRSFEYTAKPGASRPRFDNPANIRPRLYEADDSVDL
mmetsp:Transcript_7757/g.12787  ORF Transcript_7757/g.12787 Transcript_7757/m.12787 type:complete len:490 (-) Transcript_7757:1276-2745(-)